jgi:hypothetical protein
MALLDHRKSIVFRREYTQLKDILIRADQILMGSGAKFSGLKNIWSDIPGDRLLEFGAVQREKDKHKYMGRGADFLAFDELPEFTESQYRFLLRVNRTPIPNQRVRVIATGNPPTSQEGAWVIRYWAPWLDETHPNPAAPGELRWFGMIDGQDTEVDGPEEFTHDGELVTPKSRSFIPASLEDNPFLAQTDYAVVIRNLPEPLRSQLLYGDFTIGTEDDPWQLIPTAWVRLAQERWDEGLQPDMPMSALGCDVARGGSDQTVISRRYANWFSPLLKYSGRETDDGPKVAALVVKALRAVDAPVNIDLIGIGSSPYDTLVAQEINVNGVNFARKSGAVDRSGKLKMKNLRAEAWWGLREALDPQSGDDLMLPPDRELLADLTAPKFKVTTSGILVEAKEEIKERLGRSPDCGDAVALALMYGGGGGMVATDDPDLKSGSRWTGRESEGSRWSTGGSGGSRWST